MTKAMDFLATLINRGISHIDASDVVVNGSGQGGTSSGRTPI